MKLRPYQQEAVEAVYDYLRNNDDNPCVVLPTGSGKTPVIATICNDAVRRWGGRVLVLAHVKELLQQAVDKLSRICNNIPVGIYSAGLNSRNTREPIIVAGIQSVYKKACTLDRFDLILIDECHLVPPDGEGMYRTFIKDTKIINPDTRLIGFTATPYRMSSGLICAPENLLNKVCYNKEIKELIREGFLCHIHTKLPEQKIDCSNLHVRNGEFVSDEVSELFGNENTVHYIFNDIIKNTKDRNKILVFCCDVNQARLFATELKKVTPDGVGMITGDTPAKERAELIARFKDQPTGLFQEVKPLRWLVNVNVLTTGFDAQNIDCICLVRPTLSPGLYYQMVGRGFRIYPDKTDCLVLDYGNNILRHGPVDAVNSKNGKEKKASEDQSARVRECPECHYALPLRVSRCDNCGYVFPLPEPNKNIENQASQEGILSGQKTETEYEVLDIVYSKHIKKHADEKDPTTLKIDFFINAMEYVTKWVCPEHSGWVRSERFIPWWMQRTNIMPPHNTDEALYYAKNGYLAQPKRIIVIKTAGQKFPEIIERDFTDKPDPPDTPYVNVDTVIDQAIDKYHQEQRSCQTCIYCYDNVCSLALGESVAEYSGVCNNYTYRIDPSVDLSDVPF
jgi:DNA repair protein RadD